MEVGETVIPRSMLTIDVAPGRETRCPSYFATKEDLKLAAAEHVLKCLSGFTGTPIRISRNGRLDLCILQANALHALDEFRRSLDGNPFNVSDWDVYLETIGDPGSVRIEIDITEFPFTETI